jgi:hypothetical protein
MSSIRWLVRWVLIIAVISTCALLTLTVGMTRADSSTDEGTERKIPPGSAVGIDRRTTPPVLVTVPNPGSRTVEETQLALAAARFILSDNPAGDRGMESQAMAPRTLIRPGNAVTATASEATMATVKPPGDRCGPHGPPACTTRPPAEAPRRAIPPVAAPAGAADAVAPGIPTVSTLPVATGDVVARGTTTVVPPPDSLTRRELTRSLLCPG